jgi:glycosyltransferase involved in cell wall biosynthesis
LLDLPIVPRWKRPWVMGRKALSLIRSLRPDVVQFHDPELIPFAWLLQRQGRKIIYDVHEDVPKDIYSKAWIPDVLKPIAAGGMELLERLAARRFDAVVAATPAIADRFKRYGARVSLVRNTVRLDEFDQPPIKAERKRQAVYVGRVSFDRGLIEMVAACKAVGLPLVMAGGVGIKEEEWLKSYGSAVEMRGKLGRVEISALLKESLIGLCLLYPEPNYLSALPTKIFEYMAAGLPVISSDLPLSKEIVENAGCGFAVPVQAHEEIVSRINLLLADNKQAHDMGMNGRKAVSINYNWERDAAELSALYFKLSSGRSAS